MILQLFTWLATVGIIGIFVHTVRLWFVSRPAAAPPATAPGAGDGYLFTFLVPALNEVRVIERWCSSAMLSRSTRCCGSWPATGHWAGSCVAGGAGTRPNG